MMPESPSQSTARIKKALVDAGFEVFRTRGSEIVLAERPRENQIMDSGVRLRVAEPLEARVVFRAQQTDYASDDAARLFDRVRQHAVQVLPAGFIEVEAVVVTVSDPGDAERTLDSFYEVTYAKPVGALADAIGELRAALALEKRA
jgi:hypothetical protein